LTDLSPWLVLVGLGAFHGVNPAMGWLFAVALGLHRESRSVVILSLLPIALGHAFSIVLVAFALIAFALMLDLRLLQLATGTALIAWAIYHWRYGHRHRVRVGMRTGMAGLALWSFLMATSHGAGLMLVPVLIPMCLGNGPARQLFSDGAPLVALAAIGVHTVSMLVVTGGVAIAVHQWLGLAFLRRSWINFDFAWILALAAAGLFVIARAFWT
jgi:hypothetical protein